MKTAFFRNSRLFKLFVIAVFTLNAAVGYGACCVDLQPESADAESVLPCHDSGAGQAADHAKCCVACLAAIAADDEPKPRRALGVVTQLAFATPSFISNDNDPPYRPPIVPRF